MATHTAGGARMGGMPRFSSDLPTTRLGKWSMWLLFAFVALFALDMVFIAVFGRAADPGMRAFSETYLPYFGFAFLGVAFASGITGIIAMAKDHERSFMMLIAMLPLAFATVLLLGELLLPH